MTAKRREATRNEAVGTVRLLASLRNPFRTTFLALVPLGKAWPNLHAV